jgi:hypothetical protein
VVKNPTYIDPCLVTEVKYSSLTILHQIYSASKRFYTSHKYRKREGTTLRVSSKGGTLVELVSFNLVKENDFWRIWILGYIGRVHNTLLGSSRRCFGGALIYFESGMISPRGGEQSWSGSTHGKGPSLILQLGDYYILFLDSKSNLIEYFSCYWCQGGRGMNSSCNFNHQLVHNSPRLRV